MIVHEVLGRRIFVADTNGVDRTGVFTTVTIVRYRIFVLGIDTGLEHVLGVLNGIIFQELRHELGWDAFDKAYRIAIKVLTRNPLRFLQ